MVAVRSPKFDKNIDTCKKIKLIASSVNLSADTSFVISRLISLKPCYMQNFQQSGRHTSKL